MKKFITYTLLTAAVLIASVSITVLTVIYQVTNPALYTAALDQSGLYPATVDILETKITTHLTDAAQNVVTDLITNRQPRVSERAASLVEPFVIQFINQAIDQQSRSVVHSISQNIDLSASVQNTVDSGINNFVGWLTFKQPDPALFQYIPEPSRLETVKAEGVGQFIAGKLQSKWGLTDLPACDTPQSAFTNVSLIAQGNLDQITCYSPEVANVVSKGGEVVIAKAAQTQFAAKIDTLLTTYQVKAIASDIFDAFLAVSHVKQQLYNLRDGLAQAQVWAKQALLTATLMLIGGLLLTQTKRLKTFFNSLLWIGSLIFSAAFLYIITAYQSIEKLIPVTALKMTDLAVSEAQKVAFTTALSLAAKMMAQGVVQTTFYAALGILTLAAIGLIVLHFLGLSKTPPPVPVTASVVTPESTPPAKKKTTKKA